MERALNGSIINYAIKVSFIGLLLVVASCQETAIPEGPFKTDIDLSKYVLDKQVLISVLDNLRNYYDVKDLNSIQSGVEINEKEILEILTPLVENGQIIFNEMKSSIFNSQLFEGLPENEKEELYDELYQLSGTQLAELSFLFSISYYSNQNKNLEPLNTGYYSNQIQEIDWDRMISCASAAVGISSIQAIIQNNLAAASIETMIGALKHIGKRYLGWIGVGIMIYEFVNCIY